MTLVLDGVEVPADNLIGEEGKGFGYAMGALDSSRPMIGAQAVGLAQGALDVAARFVQERRQFGQRIADFQGVQFMLADMATQVEAARLLVLPGVHAARRRGRQRRGTRPRSRAWRSSSPPTPRCGSPPTRSSCSAVPGYTRRYPVERMMRDAKVTQIYEGTNQIQRVVIARRVLDQLSDPTS